MADEVQQLRERVQKLESMLATVMLGDRMRLPSNVECLPEPGTRIGITTRDRIGFWGRVPTTQHSSTGESVGHNGGGGVGLTHTDTFYGGLSFSTGNRYTINDIVKALKTSGIMAP